MVDSGRRELPRPPRRVPPGQPSQLTSIEAPRRRPAAATPAEPPLPPKFRLRFVLPLVVFALVLGAGAGWLVRQNSLTLDTAEVLETAGPSVVKVLATTCEGTGVASGVLLDDGLVLTASSSIKQPMSVALVTNTGEVRPANVLGSSTDGVAVLRMVGQLPGKAQLAPKDPPAAAERAVVAYIANGLQTIQLLGPAEEPKPLPTVLNATKLGAPALDNKGRVVGLITGDTVPTAKIVPLEKLRQYAGTGQPGITPEPGGKCPRSRGPQLPIVPELAVANTPVAGEAQKLLGNYLTATNKHDFAAVQQYYSKALARHLTEKRDRDNHQTSYLFGARIIEVTQPGAEVNARMTYTALFSPNSPGAQGQTCHRLDKRYRLVRENGRLVIDSAPAVQPLRACD